MNDYIKLTSRHHLSVKEVPEYGLKIYRVYLNSTLLNVCASSEMARSKMYAYAQKLKPLLCE
jgi:hypothetical protein